MKILYIGPTNQYGGVGHMMFSLCEHIERDSFSFDFLYYMPPTEAELKRIHKLNGEFFLIPRWSRQPVRFLREIQKFYSARHYDVVHINASSAMLNLYSLPLWKKRNRTCKIVYQSHVDRLGPLSDRILHTLLRPLVIRTADKYLAVSEAAAGFMFGKKRVRETVILRNGLDLDRFAFSSVARTETRKRLNLENSYVIGTVGRFSPPKNPLFIIRVFEYACRLDSGAVLLWIGTGEDEDRTRKLAAELGVADRVVFYGTTDNVRPFLCAMDCFFFPSRWEGLGIAALEAQMNGLPVIASDRVPPEAKVTENYTALSLTDDSMEKWAETLLSFQSEEGDYARFSHYEDLLAHGYDIKATAGQLERIYAEDAYEVRNPDIP